MTDTRPDNDPQRLAPRRHFITVVAVIVGVAVGCFLVHFARDNGEDILAPLGLTFAAAGMGAECAVLYARAKKRRKKRREPPRLALLLATTATFVGAFLTVAATGLDLQDDVGGGWQPLGFVAILALALAVVAAWLVWHVSAVLPSPRALSKPGRHVTSNVTPSPAQPPQP